MNHIKRATPDTIPFTILHDNRRTTIADWRAARSEYAGASDIAAILGVSKYRGPFEVAAVKLGKLSDFGGNAKTRLGSLMESPILAYWHAENALADDPIDLAEVYTCAFTLRHPTHAIICANLDAFGVDTDGAPFVVEVKHAGSYARGALRAWSHGAQPRGITLEYYTQIQAQMCVTGCAYGYLVALCDKDLFSIKIWRDPESSKIIEREIPAFWARYITTGTLPPPSFADTNAIGAVYPPRGLGDDEITISRPDLADHVERARIAIAAHTDTVNDHKAAIDTLKNSIKAIMGTAEVLLLGDGIKPVKWRTVTPRGATGRPAYRRFSL